MSVSRALDARQLMRRFQDLLATAWVIAALAAIGIVAAGLALIVLPAVFLAAWSLETLHSIKLID